jgi:hypothetical protein
MIEIWKDIPDYEGLYQASNLGKIKSLKYNHIYNKCKNLKGRITPKKYLMVALYKNNIRKDFKIHRLILQTFIGKSDLQCNHKNGIKTDNRLENLEYCTNKQNFIHALKTGLRDDCYKKLYKPVNQIEAVHEFYNKKFSLSKSAIEKIIKEKYNEIQDIIQEYNKGNKENIKQYEDLIKEKDEKIYSLEFEKECLEDSFETAIKENTKLKLENNILLRNKQKPKDKIIEWLKYKAEEDHNDLYDIQNARELLIYFGVLDDKKNN